LHPLALKAILQRDFLPAPLRAAAVRVEAAPPVPDKS